MTTVALRELCGVRSGDKGDISDLTLYCDDRATYDSPHEMATGMDWVLVNGRVAVKEGAFTGVRAGRVLKR